MRTSKKMDTTQHVFSNLSLEKLKETLREICNQWPTNNALKDEYKLALEQWFIENPDIIPLVSKYGSMKEHRFTHDNKTIVRFYDNGRVTWYENNIPRREDTESYKSSVRIIDENLLEKLEEFRELSIITDKFFYTFD